MDSTTGAMADLFRVKLSFERVGGDDDDRGDFVVFSGTGTTDFDLLPAASWSGRVVFVRNDKTSGALNIDPELARQLDMATLVRVAGEKMGIDTFHGSSLDSHLSGDRVYEYDDFPVRLPGDHQCVKAGEFQVWAEVSTDITVHHRVCER